MSALLKQMMEDGPAGLWPMQESSFSSGSTVRDVSGNARHGTCYAGVNMTPTADPGWGSYPLLGASPSGHVTFGSLAAWEGPAVSVCFWLKPSAVAQAPGVVVSKYDGSSSGFWTVNLAVDAAGVVTSPEWYWFRQSTYDVWKYYAGGDPTPPAAGTWNYYCGVTDASANMIMYRNGVELGRNTAGPTGTRATSSSFPMVLGAYGSGAFDYIGGVSHLAVYPAALTPARMMAHYRAGMRRAVMVG